MESLLVDVISVEPMWGIITFNLYLTHTDSNAVC